MARDASVSIEIWNFETRIATSPEERRKSQSRNVHSPKNTHMATNERYDAVRGPRSQGKIAFANHTAADARGRWRRTSRGVTTSRFKPSHRDKRVCWKFPGRISRNVNDIAGGGDVRRAMALPPALQALRAFHGHLGVYVTLGLRMGAVGRRRFGHYKGLSAAVRARLQPPVLCLVDGVPFSSGCTMGKGNIRVADGENPEVVFTKEGTVLRISLQAGWRERIDRGRSKGGEGGPARYYFDLPESELFDIDEA